MNNKVTDIIIIFAFLFALSAITYGSKIALNTILTLYGMEIVLWICALSFAIELMIAILIIIGMHVSKF